MVLRINSHVPCTTFLAGASSSLLESSLLELSASFFAFLADGPLTAAGPLVTALRFLVSGDLEQANHSNYKTTVEMTSKLPVYDQESPTIAIQEIIRHSLYILHPKTEDVHETVLILVLRFLMRLKINCKYFLLILYTI